MALGSGSVTVPSTSMASFFGKLSQVFLVAGQARSAHGRAETAPGRERPDSIRASPWTRPCQAPRGGEIRLAELRLASGLGLLHHHDLVLCGGHVDRGLDALGDVDHSIPYGP